MGEGVGQVVAAGVFSECDGEDTARERINLSGRVGGRKGERGLEERPSLCLLNVDSPQD